MARSALQFNVRGITAVWRLLSSLASRHLDPLAVFVPVADPRSTAGSLRLFAGSRRVKQVILRIAAEGQYRACRRPRSAAADRSCRTVCTCGKRASSGRSSGRPCPNRRRRRASRRKRAGSAPLCSTQGRCRRRPPRAGAGPSDRHDHEPGARFCECDGCSCRRYRSRHRGRQPRHAGDRARPPRRAAIAVPSLAAADNGSDDALARSIWRIAWFSVSTINRLPSRSSAISFGASKTAATAWAAIAAIAAPGRAGDRVDQAGGGVDGRAGCCPGVRGYRPCRRARP